MDALDPYAPPRRRRGIALPLAALALAFLAGIALTAFAIRRWQVPAWLQPATPVQAVVAPIAAPPPVALPVAAAPIDQALAQRVDLLEGRLQDVDRRSEDAIGDATRAEGLLVAFAARRAIDRGQQLGFLEGMLRQRFGPSDAAGVATIVGAAQHPVTLVQLQDRLGQLAPALQGPAANEGWWQGFRRELGGLFVVRRTDVPSAQPVDRLDRASRALESGQVEIALAEVAKLPGSSRAADWIAAARRYVLARNALDRIETAALLAPPPAASTPPAPLGD